MRLPDILSPSAEPREVEDSATIRRRRVTVVVTLLVGSALLGGTLAAPEGSGLFYAFGVLVAATWMVGSRLSGPLPLGRRGGAAGGGREIVAPLLLGGILFLAFDAAAALMGDRIPFLTSALHRVLEKADGGSRGLVLGVAVLNAVAEEVFFRGAVHSALGRHHPALWATALYVLVTVATLNPALVLAAAAVGVVFTAEREATRGVLAPVITHVTWSTLILFLLPR